MTASTGSSSEDRAGATPGNRLTLLETGDAYFPALLAALDEARIEVHLETYIFADDRTGLRVAEALAACARRGCAVRVVVDGFGSRNLPPALHESLARAGVELIVYRPLPKGFSLHVQHLRRLHRKLAVIDGRIGFCGGINVLDDRHGRDDLPPRFDFAVRVEGPLVADLHRLMRRLWRLLSWHALQLPRPLRLPRFPTPPGFPEGHTARLVTRDNLRHRRAIEDAYLAALTEAHSDIMIACAYFLPGRRIRQALIEAAQRGVRVRLLLQGHPDHLLIHSAALAMYDRLLGAGVEIREYQPAHLHAKAAVVDSEWATLGSSNIDPFSLWLSREANLVLRDASLVALLHRSLEQAYTHEGVAVTREASRVLPLGLRLRARVAYHAGRLLLALTGLVARDEF
jgi:cardiolipin synthase